MTCEGGGGDAGSGRGSRLRAGVGCVGALLLVALSVYLMSYFIVRTITVGSFLSSEDARYVQFGYPGGGGRTYPVTKAGAKFLFLLAEVVEPGGGVSPVPFTSPARGEKTGSGGAGGSWFWAVCVPLERLELFCRGYGPVHLTEEEKAAARKEAGSMIKLSF
ncbi:MAG: hypothetical protein ABIF82_11945 [Planctomycetota bacterium]